MLPQKEEPVLPDGTVKIAKAILTDQKSRSRFSGFGTLEFNTMFLWGLG